MQEASSQSQVTIQQANPTSTSDAMASLVNEFAHNSSNLIISPSLSNVANINNKADEINNAEIQQQQQQQHQVQQQQLVVNNRLTSTVKKEQLEYEFRLRPRMILYKANNQFQLNSNFIKRKKCTKKAKGALLDSIL